MTEASFYRVVLNLVRSIKIIKLNNLEELANSIDSEIIKSLDNEKKVVRRKDDKSYLVDKFIKRHEELEVTILEIEILKLMLETLKTNEEIISKYFYLNYNYPILISVVENITEKLHSYRLVRISK